MSARECQKDRSYLRLRPTTCIEALAEGWILSTDLCPTCTRKFMAALDGHRQAADVALELPRSGDR